MVLITKKYEKLTWVWDWVSGRGINKLVVPYGLYPYHRRFVPLHHPAPALKKIIQFGFEREFFLSNGKTFVFLPKDTKIPHDNCGYLAEARSKPSASPWYVSRLYYSAVNQLDWLCRSHGLKLIDINETVFDPLFIQEIRRTYGTKRVHFETFLVGGQKYEYRNRAGFHVHFQINKFFTRGLRINIIKYMDSAFATEIKESNRISGEYEFKPWGFEYRSLPANVNVNKLVNVLEEMQYKFLKNI